MEDGNLYLNTKFILPVLPKNFVQRKNLFARLDEGHARKVVLVYAPAGYGKSTLINSWVRSLLEKDAHNRVSWLSLGPHDDQPSVFFSYFIKSLQTIDREIGAWAYSLLDISDFPIENIVTSLINDLAAREYPCCVVLDDYHWISHPLIHRGLTYLVDHLPPNTQLILISRETPPLPLYRMRIYGDLLELDMQDLKFSLTETKSFLSDFMGLFLNDDLIQAIQNNTEGWVAGLQIAALSIRNKTRFGFKKIDLSTNLFDENKTASTFFYQEVLLKQPEEIQQFFLKTSILERLCGPLCDEVVGIQNSAEILDHLRRSNGFLIQLGDTSQWFRYHPLFVNFLITHLSAEEIAALQIKASRWHEANGMLVEALQYAFAAGETAAAVRILVELLPELINKGETNLLVSWIKKLPQEMIVGNAYMATILGWMLYHSGKGTQATPYLKAVEKINPENISPRQKWFYQLVLEEICNSKGQLAEALEYARRAAEISRPAGWRECSEHEIYGETLRLMGDFRQAQLSFRETLQLCREEHNLLIEAFAVQHLSNILYQQGQSNEARLLCEDFIGRLTDNDGANHPLSGYGFIPMAHLYYESNQLELARQYLETGLQLISATRLVKPLIRGRLLQARLCFLNGDIDNTHRILALVQDVAHDLKHVEYQIITAAESAELELRMGNSSACERWLNSAGARLDTGCISLHEPLHLTHARLLIAKRKPAEAEAILLRLREYAQAQNRVASLIKVNILLARCCHLQGSFPSTCKYLENAVQLGAPIQYYRTFLDQDEDIAPLLAAVQDASPHFVKTLLDEITKIHGAHPAVSSDFFIHFSEREHEILRLVTENYSNKEIANRLYITVGTTKWYLNNIFKKMGVKNRREAVDTLQKINRKNSPGIQT